MDNRLCVSIGTNDINLLKKMIDESFASTADFVEIRFDFFNGSVIDDVLDRVLEYKEKAVFTCRTRAEGGKFTGGESDRVTTIQRLASFRPMLLDVEYNTVLSNQSLLDMFAAINCETLISWHNFELTPQVEELKEQMNKMKAYSRNVKIVTMAKNPDDNASILKLYEHAKASNTDLIAFCMGDHGVLSRILCTYAGARFAYASFSDGIAPGQLTLRQMKSIYERLQKEKPELSNYSSWKERNDFSEILTIVNKTRASDSDVS